MCQEGLLNSNTYDQELVEVFTIKPRRYTVSMLRSQREEVVANLRANAEKSTTMVETAAAAVSSARMDFLEAGLRKDWQMATHMKGAASILRDEQHLWQQKWLLQQVPKERKQQPHPNPDFKCLLQYARMQL